MRLASLAAAAMFGAFTLTAQAQTPVPAGTPGAAAIVHIAGFAYAPATVSVRAGQVVEFINDDDDAHTVTATDGSFDSGYLAKGDHWDHTFATAGQYAYICTYHQFMKGTITVTAP